MVTPRQLDRAWPSIGARLIGPEFVKKGEDTLFIMGSWAWEASDAYDWRPCLNTPNEAVKLENGNIYCHKDTWYTIADGTFYDDNGAPRTFNRSNDWVSFAGERQVIASTLKAWEKVINNEGFLKYVPAFTAIDRVVEEAVAKGNEDVKKWWEASQKALDGVKRAESTDPLWFMKVYAPVELSTEDFKAAMDSIASSLPQEERFIKEVMLAMYHISRAVFLSSADPTTELGKAKELLRPDKEFLPFKPEQEDILAILKAIVELATVSSNCTGEQRIVDYALLMLRGQKKVEKKKEDDDGWSVCNPFKAGSCDQPPKKVKKGKAAPQHEQTPVRREEATPAPAPAELAPKQEEESDDEWGVSNPYK